MSAAPTSSTVLFRMPFPSSKVQKLLQLWQEKLTPQQRLFSLVGLAAFMVLVSFVTYRMMFFESTDDSFVKARVHTVSARTSGTVLEILVQENQKVKKGDVLLKLDSRDHEVAIKAAQANYSKAHKDLGRFRGYLDQLGPTDRPVFDQYQASALVSEAELTRAQLQYEYTSVIAAEDGTVGRRSVETGEMIQAGQALMPLVEPQPWIEANFKEHQVAKIHPGQKVHIHIDSIPDHAFEGTVESIAPGSGSTFSLLPPDNATGNFTKIVQRIPVKITFDPEALKGYEDRLITGMSTEVRVKVR